MPRVARAENVGSLLRPPELLAARDRVRQGSMGREELRALEDDAILQAIALQERCGLDVVSDGELRRGSWAQMPEVLDCFDELPASPGLIWRSPDGELRPGPQGAFPTVVRPIGPDRGKRIEEDYAFLTAHTSFRTKYSLPAPSYHRRYWSDEHSSGAYDSCERFLEDVRDVQRELVEHLVDLGCDYVQLDAPNYGSACDAGYRQRALEAGRDVQADLAFDAALDNSLVAGLDAVTSALHICRGNGPGGIWHSSGGYGAISKQLFPLLDFDALLLEYDTDRAGDFGPLADVRPGTIAVLGLLTTKLPTLEDEALIEARIEEAAQLKPLAELALSTQCGFASMAPGNALTAADEEAKLRRVSEVAHRVWGAAA